MPKSVLQYLMDKVRYFNLETAIYPILFFPNKLLLQYEILEGLVTYLVANVALQKHMIKIKVISLKRGF